MFTKNLLAVRFTFNKRYRFKSANNALGSIAKPTDAAERVEHP